jgi:hypothetical protein
MIRCMISRASSNARWLTTANRRYTSLTSTSCDLQENGSSGTKPSATEGAASADVDGVVSDRKRTHDTDGHTSRINDCSQPQSIPYRRRALPLSPFMDPNIVAAREKPHLPKIRPGKNPTLFQQQLSRNPYALALATPVRRCQITKTALPKYFLQDFALMAHPKKGNPWWVPTSLKKKYGVFEDTEPVVDENQVGSAISSRTADERSNLPLQPEISDTGNSTTDAACTPLIKAKSPSNIPPESKQTQPPPSPKLGLDIYTVSHQPLLHSLRNRKQRQNHW